MDSSLVAVICWISSFQNMTRVKVNSFDLSLYVSWLQNRKFIQEKFVNLPNNTEYIVSCNCFPKSWILKNQYYGITNDLIYTAQYSVNCLAISPWTQDVNWKYIRHSEDVQDVFWTSYVRSVYVLCLRGYYATKVKGM